MVTVYTQEKSEYTPCGTGQDRTTMAVNIEHQREGKKRVADSAQRMKSRSRGRSKMEYSLNGSKRKYSHIYHQKTIQVTNHHTAHTLHHTHSKNPPPTNLTS